VKLVNKLASLFPRNFFRCSNCVRTTKFEKVVLDKVVSDKVVLDKVVSDKVVLDKVVLD
jgi:hypothetical protein